MTRRRDFWINVVISKDNAIKTIHFMCWERWLWSGPATQKRMAREGWTSDGRAFYPPGAQDKHRGIVPCICSDRHFGVYGKNQIRHRMVDASSEPGKVTCATCLSRLCLLGIACGCLR